MKTQCYLLAPLVWLTWIWSWPSRQVFTFNFGLVPAWLFVGVTTVGGVIDSDYRGHINAILHNSGDQNVVIAKGQRVTSGVFLPTLPVCSSKQQMFFLRLSEECLDLDHLISFFFVCIVMLFSFFTLHSIQNLLQIRNDDHWEIFLCLCHKKSPPPSMMSILDWESQLGRFFRSFSELDSLATDLQQNGLRYE